MEEMLQAMADELTRSIMCYVYGERFENTDDLTEDEELSKAWEAINERTCGSLWAAYDVGYDVGYDAGYDE